MTVFGADWSHYNAKPTSRDGIDFFAHKATEGYAGYQDPAYRTAVTAARDLGIPILGSYHVLWNGSLEAQAGAWLSRVNAETPWWRDFPYWVWQIDAEKWTWRTTTPTVAEINTFGDLIAKMAGVNPGRVLAYAPPWVYGNALKGLKYQLWSSNYGPNVAGPYRLNYPGDGSSRWLATIDPLILQYGSQATISGQHPCDANAYRGSLTQLRAALDSPHYRIQTGATTEMTPSEAYIQHVMNYRLDAVLHNRLTVTVPAFGAYPGFAESNDLAIQLAAILAALTNAGSPDAAAILAGVQTDLDALRLQVRADSQELLTDLATGGAEKVQGDTTPVS